MRRIFWPILLVLLLLAGAGFLLMGENARSGAETGLGRAATAVTFNDSAAQRTELADAVAPRRTRSKGERDLLRRWILDAIETRERAAVGTRGAPETAAAAPVAAGAKPTPEAPLAEAPAGGGMVDQTGNHGYLMKVLNEDLMPLADECYALARASRPELAGLLVLDLELLGDEDLGGVVEAIAPGQHNAVEDPLLLECMRESILAVTLPAPPQGGRDALSLSIPLSPEEADEAQGSPAAPSGGQ